MIFGQNNYSEALPPAALPAPLASLQLASHLLIAFEMNLIRCNRKEEAMTARERQFLILLTYGMLTSRGYLPITRLISELLPEPSDEDDELLKNPDPGHCIETMVTSVRRKFGEIPYKPQYLVCCRGLGYQLRPQIGYGYLISPLTGEPEQILNFILTFRNSC